MTASGDRLAKALIDDVHAARVDEQRSEIDRLQAELESARRRLQDVERLAANWRRRGRLDHEMALRALALAQASDLHESATIPRGVHLRALREYLAENHPPRLSADLDAPPDHQTPDRDDAERAALRRLHPGRDRRVRRRNLAPGRRPGRRRWWRRRWHRTD